MIGMVGHKAKLGLGAGIAAALAAGSFLGQLPAEPVRHIPFQPDAPAKARRYKGSPAARRATRRGGNPARTKRAAFVAHHWGYNTQTCMACRATMRGVVGGTESDRCVPNRGRRYL